MVREVRRCPWGQVAGVVRLVCLERGLPECGRRALDQLRDGLGADIIVGLTRIGLGFFSPGTTALAALPATWATPVMTPFPSVITILAMRSAVEFPVIPWRPRSSPQDDPAGAILSHLTAGNLDQTRLRGGDQVVVAVAESPLAPLLQELPDQLA